MQSIPLGKLQMELMEILWENGPATAKEILERMSGGHRCALSTIQTLLRRLERKRMVSHCECGRTFVFEAAIKREEVQKSAFDDLYHTVFDGSASKLVAHLIESEVIEPEEFEALQNLIEERRSRGKR